MNLWFEESFLTDFDCEVQEFYHRVVSKEISLRNSTNVLRVKRAMQEVVGAYVRGTVDALASRILFDTPEKRCAYIVKHCACFTSAVAKHFFKLLSSEPMLILPCIERRVVRICCLGGGPASDAVAILKVLGALKRVRVRRGTRLRFEISVIDISEDWKETAHAVLKTLEEDSKMFSSEKELSFQFLKADLTQEWSKEVSGAIRGADVVTMIYFVSAVNGSPASGRCSDMLQRIMESLKPEAVLFFLDSSKNLHYTRVHKEASKQTSSLRQVYGPNLQDFHYLSMKSIKTFLDLYSSAFKMYVCLTNCFTATAAWVKLPSPASSRLKESHWQLNTKSNAWRKLEAYNTLKQELFLQKVERLLMRQFGLRFVLEESGEGEKFDHDFDLYEKVLYASKSKRKQIYSAC